MAAGPDACPPEIVQIIEQAPLHDEAAGDLFSRVSDGTTLACQLHALTTVADRLNQFSHPAAVGDFCDAAATYARVLTPEQVAAVRAAYLRFPYDDAIAHSYFAGLRRNAIDIRDHLDGRVRQDWAFRQPNDEAAATWHHFLYLASLGEPGALEALAGKIEQTANGNDATNLLRSFAALQGPAATQVLRRYGDDPRRADGVDGPGTGMTIAEAVEQILAYR